MTIQAPSDPGTTYVVPRDGDLDLEFTGWIVGTGEQGDLRNSNRGTTVTIYLSSTGHIVTAVEQWTRGRNPSSTYRAGVHTEAAAALAWLYNDCGGTLGRASKQAWQAACQTLPALRGSDVKTL